MDAVLAPWWPPQDGGPYLVRSYAPFEVVEVRLQVEGVVRTGVLLEHADRAEGRALHVWFSPPLRTGERDRWVWWSPERIGLRLRTGVSPLERQRAEGDAVPVPPAAGRLLIETRCLRHPLPAVDVRLAGAWHPAQLLSRMRLADGLETAVVWVMLPAPEWDTRARFTRTYRWNPAAIRPRVPRP